MQQPKTEYSLRQRMLHMLYKAGRGHLPSACSCVDIIYTLYTHILRVRPAEPLWHERDRFILSKGHGCLALYVVLAQMGFLADEELDSFCALDSRLGGHPERSLLPGIEATTGSLGHGPSLGVGMALAARLDKRDSRVYVLCGDGETNEGSVWEACLSASKHNLDKFTLIIDYNKQQSWDDVDAILPLEPYAQKFAAFGFAVIEVDGHDTLALQQALASLSKQVGKPQCLICHTVKGKGFSSIEKDLSWHHKTRLTTEEYEHLLKDLHFSEAKKL